jgi:hypothetical protein
MRKSSDSIKSESREIGPQRFSSKSDHKKLKIKQTKEQQQSNRNHMKNQKMSPNSSKLDDEEEHDGKNDENLEYRNHHKSIQNEINSKQNHQNNFEQQQINFDLFRQQQQQQQQQQHQQQNGFQDFAMHFNSNFAAAIQAASLMGPSNPAFSFFNRTVHSTPPHAPIPSHPPSQQSQHRENFYYPSFGQFPYFPFASNPHPSSLTAQPRLAPIVTGSNGADMFLTPPPSSSHKQINSPFFSLDSSSSDNNSSQNTSSSSSASSSSCSSSSPSSYFMSSSPNSNSKYSSKFLQSSKSPLHNSSSPHQHHGSTSSLLIQNSLNFNNNIDAADNAVVSASSPHELNMFNSIETNSRDNLND